MERFFVFCGCLNQLFVSFLDTSGMISEDIMFIGKSMKPVYPNNDKCPTGDGLLFVFKRIINTRLNNSPIQCFCCMSCLLLAV